MTKQLHLSPSEFSDKFFKKFEEAVYRAPAFGPDANQCDTILAMVFADDCSWHKQLKEHLEAQVEDAANYEQKSIEIIGYNFHKGFRSWDPLDAERMNSVIWQAISGSKVFWDVLDSVCTELDQGEKNFEKVLDTGDN